MASWFSIFFTGDYEYRAYENGLPEGVTDANEAFRYVISDGDGDTAPAFLFINVVAPGLVPIGGEHLPPPTTGLSTLGLGSALLLTSDSDRVTEDNAYLNVSDVIDGPDDKRGNLWMDEFLAGSGCGGASLSGGVLRMVQEYAEGDPACNIGSRLDSFLSMFVDKDISAELV